MQFRPHHMLMLAASLLATPLVEAHPLANHGDALQALLHPFTGIDHVMAMLVVGLWAGLAAPGRRLLAPLAFVGGLLGGAALGALGVAMPAVETGIALSVLLLGPLAARNAHLPALLAFAVCAVAGMFHGYAHGLELSGLGLSGACFVLGSLSLHALGYALARRLGDSGRVAMLRGALSVSGLLGLGLLWMA